MQCVRDVLEGMRFAVASIAGDLMILAAGFAIARSFVLTVSVDFASTVRAVNNLNVVARVVGWRS